MEREGEKEKEKMGDNSWRQTGLGQRARVVEKKGEPRMDCQGKKKEGEQLDSQLDPRAKPRRQNDVLRPSYQVDVVCDDKWRLGSGQKEESLHTATGVHRVEES